VVIALAAAIVSGCGAPAASVVDVSKLDSGNYPTEPQPVKEDNSFDEAVHREGRRLAEHVPLAYEADPQLTFGHAWPGHINTAKHPPRGPVSARTFAVDAPGLIVSWSTDGQRRRDASDGRSMTQYVLRFDSAASAAHAGQTLPAAQLAELGYQPLTVPGQSLARGAWKPGDTQRTASYYVWAPHGSYLLFAYLFDPVSVPPNLAAAATQLGSALAKQAEYLRGYQPTSVSDIVKLPADTSDLLKRTLPRDNQDRGTADPPGVYTLRAAAAYAYDPRESLSAYRDAGVELIAIRDSLVAPARDAAAARGLISKLSKRFPEDLDPAKPPPGMPGTECAARKEKTDGNRPYLARFTCYTSYDRYFAVVSGANQQDTYQRTAAQYKILASSK
jgi:hypothetical protein